MAKTRGGLSTSPSSPTPRPHQAAMGGTASSPVQAPPFPHLRGEPLLSADTPPGGHPLTLCHQQIKPRACFSATSEENQVLGSWRAIPATSGRAAYRGTSDSYGDYSETVIRRPMIAGPPIEGNLDCRDRSFHSETYFDIEALRQQPSSEIHSDCCRARHIAEALRIPYEPVIQADFREWSSFSQSDMVRILSRGTSTASVLTRRELPSGMLLIDVLLRATSSHFSIKESPSKEASEGNGIPLLFPRLLCQILEHLGYPEEPRLERRRHCREDFSLVKWHHLVAYFAPQGAPVVPAPPELPRDDQLPQAQQDEILTNTTPPAPAAHTSVHMPEAIHSTSPITQGAPPVMPATPAPPPSSEPTVTVSLTEFRGLVRSLQTLSTAQDSIIQQMATIRAHQDQIIATQAQHTTILYQI
ncbi:hypothetical protein CK203_044644 [Vitis vinifera]|uniref:Uncharacterized protein n=1 Tax=Vitis vinifera TaxID=29760 RepID=A0A438HJJ8_VITVI|nr:hypothetical protein CK203_044644 [Vitis vinifera]